MQLGIGRVGAIGALDISLIRWFLPVPRALRGLLPVDWWMTEPGIADRTKSPERWRRFCIAVDLFGFTG